MEKVFKDKAGLVIILFIFQAIILQSCSKTDTINVSGFLEAEKYDVISEVQGKVLEILKNEGDVIKKGEIFAKVDSSIYEHTVKQLEKVVEAKTAKLDEVLRGARNEEVEGAKAKVTQAQALYESSKKAVESAKINMDYANDKYNDVSELYKELKISDDEVNDAKFKFDSAQKAYEDANTKIESAKSSLESISAQYRLVLSGATQESVKIATADLDSAKEQLEASKLALEKYNIKAPIDGIVTIKNVNRGQVLNPGSNIAELQDIKDMYVKIYIPQKELNKISLNKEIILNSYSDKNLIVKGKVSYISPKAEFTPKNIETNEAKESTVYQVKVKIDEGSSIVKPGMTLETNI